MLDSDCESDNLIKKIYLLKTLAVLTRAKLGNFHSLPPPVRYIRLHSSKAPAAAQGERRSSRAASYIFCLGTPIFCSNFLEDESFPN